MLHQLRFSAQNSAEFVRLAMQANHAAVATIDQATQRALWIQAAAYLELAKREARREQAPLADPSERLH